jgi:hypothetical protein
MYSDEQYNIAFKIFDKLETNATENINIRIEIMRKKNNPQEKNLLEQLKRDIEMRCLSIYEFLALLINTGEIENSRIIDFFKMTLISDTQIIFEEYPEIKEDKTMLQELHKLLALWE